VFDFGEGDESGEEPPYLVLELIRGEPLSTIIAREAPLDPERTWSVLGQAASALSAAHAAGVVHRDVKPANLLVCPDGALKVTDFGIARATGASAVTTGGNMLGTPHYISPEQVAGEPVTAASDFYALGAVAYECLTGKRLYDGEPMAVLLAHREKDPPPLPTGVPAALRDLVTAMLDKDPQRRPTDGRAIAAQAERLNTPTLAIPVLPEAYPAEPPVAPSSPPDAEAPSPEAEELPEAVVMGPTTGVLPAPVLRGRRWQRPIAIAAAAVLVAAIGVLVAVGLGSGGHGTPSANGTGNKAPTASAQPLHVASVQPSAGNGGEADHPEEASLATDGDPSSAWYTQHYASATFGNLRSGAGLLFDLGRPVKVASLRVRLAVPGVSVELKAANSVDRALGAHTIAGTANAASAWALHPDVTARYWLLWFTRLAPSDGAYRAGVADAQFSS
jgi:serine/threonine-protein kinase